MAIDISDVRRVSEKVDPDGYDATRYMQKDQDVTWLFEDLNGGKAAGNVYSTREKIARAMGIPKEDIVRHVMDAMASPEDTEVTDSPAFKQCELPLNLMALPIVKYFPEDAGRYISAGLVVSEYGGRDITPSTNINQIEAVDILQRGIQTMMYFPGFFMIIA